MILHVGIHEYTRSTSSNNTETTFFLNFLTKHGITSGNNPADHQGAMVTDFDYCASEEDRGAGYTGNISLSPGLKPAIHHRQLPGPTGTRAGWRVGADSPGITEK